MEKPKSVRRTCAASIQQQAKDPLQHLEGGRFNIFKETQFNRKLAKHSLKKVEQKDNKGTKRTLTSSAIRALDIEVPRELTKFFANKASAVINGVSLTTNRVETFDAVVDAITQVEAKRGVVLEV